MTKILIVDDEEWMQNIYEDELTRERYEVITSCDGSKVLELISPS